MLNYATIPLIVVICYTAITAIKATTINSKWYPLFSCAIGAAVAAVFFFVLPEFIAAASLTAAIISGAVSGLAATGTNQVFKQLIKAAEAGTLTIENESVVKDETPAQNVGKTNDTGGNAEDK